MTDMMKDFMERLRAVWPSVPVVAGHTVDPKGCQIGVSIQRWVQTPNASEVQVNVSFYPTDESPMKQMLNWLQEFYTLIRSDDPVHPLTEWWGQTANFATDPMAVTCGIVLRHPTEVA